MATLGHVRGRGPKLALAERSAWEGSRSDDFEGYGFCNVETNTKTLNMKTYKEVAQSWLDGNFDAETKAEVKHLMETDQTALEDAFYRNLEFGTGGLRGVMGVGTNRMNKYTVGMATQGLANYIKAHVSGDFSLIRRLDK